MTNAYEIERLEREAKARGLTVWELEMSRAVGDKEMADLRGDARRSSPAFPSPVAVSEAKQIGHSEPDPDLTEVIHSAGLNPRTVPGEVWRQAERLLKEGGSKGAAAAALYKMFKHI